MRRSSSPPVPAGRFGEYRRLGAPVKAMHAGERLDGYLAREFPFLSRSGWQKRIERELLQLNGLSVKSATRLKAGDVLTLFAPPAKEPPVDKGVHVLWQDRGVMAVFKPGNLPMHENGPYRKNTFTEIVWQKMGREWSAVHRLDRETSGIVLCGATATLRARLAIDWEARKVRKEYLAIAHGTPQQRQWTANGAIGAYPGSQIRIKKWVVDGGLPAATDFVCLEAARDFCLLQAKPLTGRTNQIRVHAAHAGHVLVGDKLYNPDESVFLEYFAKGATPEVNALAGFPRHCLHAAALEFVHPATGEWQRVEAPLPSDMAELWARVTLEPEFVPKALTPPPLSH